MARGMNPPQAVTVTTEPQGKAETPSARRRREEGKQRRWERYQESQWRKEERASSRKASSEYRSGSKSAESIGLDSQVKGSGSGSNGRLKAGKS